MTKDFPPPPNKEFSDAVHKLRTELYSREMKEDLQEALKIEAYLRVIVFLHDVHRKVDEAPGKDMRESIKSEIMLKINALKSRIGMD